MNILILTRWYPTPEVPYAGAFVRDQAVALARAGVSVSVMHPEVTPFGSRLPAFEKHVVEDGVALFQTRTRSPLPRVEAAFEWATERLVCRMAPWVARAGRPDLIHAHVSYPTGMAAIRLGRAWNVPVVATEHHSPFPALLAHPWARRSALSALGAAKEVIAVSQALATAMREEGVERPIRILPNIVDSNCFEVKPLPDSETLDLLSVGSLVPMKDHAMLFEALGILARRQPEQLPRLTLIGEGPLRGTLEALAQRLGIAENVRFLGAQPRAEVAEALVKSSALVVSSSAETFCVAAAEALSAGRPVISTRCGGPEDFLSERTGEWVPVGDPQAMAEGLLRLRARMHEFVPEALAREAKARFAPEVIAKSLLEAYAPHVGGFTRE